LEVFNFLPELFNILRWQDIIDILLVGFVVYRVLLILKGTRAAQVLFGLILIALVFFISEMFGFYTINYLVRQFFQIQVLIILMLVLFQNEIKQALANMGKTRFFTKKYDHDEFFSLVDKLEKGVNHLLTGRIGSLIVLERDQSLLNLTEKSTEIGAKLSPEILLSIFQPKSPIHDGAVVVKNERVTHAGCFIHLNRDVVGGIEKQFGTRHLAALSLSHDTDAVVIVTSEERGELSLAHKGKFLQNINLKEFKNFLIDEFQPRMEDK